MERLGLTVAVDTNVLLRLLVEDDEAQAVIARAIFEGPCAVSATVLLEAGWVLASRYRWPRTAIADALIAVLDMPGVIVDPETLGWALERYRCGGDLPDMIHIAMAGSSERFATFDASIAQDAGDNSPVPVGILA